jgi:excisionase family DNA binding protein
MGGVNAFLFGGAVERMKETKEADQGKYKNKMLSLKEAAQYIHMGKSTLYQCANRGKIRCYKPPVGQILFNVEDLDAWLDMSEISAGTGTVKG